MKQKVSFVFHWTKGLQRKAEFFWIHYFWRTKRKSTETITERCFSCQNKSVCQKLAQSCKKWKLAKIQYTSFLHEGLQLGRPGVVSNDLSTHKPKCSLGTLALYLSNPPRGTLFPWTNWNQVESCLQIFKKHEDSWGAFCVIILCLAKNHN